MTVYNGGNLAWQLGGDRQLVLSLAAKADVLALVECRNFANEPVDVKKILGDGWHVWQNLRSGALAGTAIAVREDSEVKRRRITGPISELVQISQGTHDVQARYLRSVKLRDDDGPLTVMGAHAPLKSTGLQDEAMAVISRKWRGTRGRKVMFADGNQPPAEFADALGAPHFSGSGVMTVVWSHGWDDFETTWKARAGSDHKTATFRSSE